MVSTNQSHEFYKVTIVESWDGHRHIIVFHGGNDTAPVLLHSFFAGRGWMYGYNRDLIYI